MKKASQLLNLLHFIIIKRKKDAEEAEKKLEEPSLTRCLIKVFAGKFLAGSFMHFVQVMLHVNQNFIITY